jgi:hypothetical protein
MRRRYASAAMLLLASIALISCTTRVGDLTVATPKNLPVTFTEVKKGLVGRDCAYSVLGIPLGVLNPTIDGAIDAALEQAEGADALVDASIYNDIMIALIVNSNCIRIQGTAIRTK